MILIETNFIQVFAHRNNRLLQNISFIFGIKPNIYYIWKVIENQA